MAIVCAAQHDRASGIEGFVTADVTASIPNARIGVDSVTKGLHRETVTDASGYYLFSELNPGAYSVWAEVPGLGCIVYPHVVVFPGQIVRQDFHFVRARPYAETCEPIQKKVK
ncbi:MAG TPA: carboxypeptidase-like regulatory domain-containing protein [Bryobacteraceae bacterium]